MNTIRRILISTGFYGKMILSALLILYVVGWTNNLEKISLDGSFMDSLRIVGLIIDPLGAVLGWV